MASAADEEQTSLDYMVLEPSSNSPADHSGQGEISLEELISQREEAILKLCSICGTDDDGKNLRPFRIVVVGKHGAGKSSFINGVAAALSEDRWHEYAYTGDLGRGAPITIVNQRLVKCCNEDRERYKNVLLPTVIDVAGLSDETDDKLEELLRLLFYGHIQEDEPLMRVYEDCTNSSREEIRTKYSQSFTEMRVDRVIFVASAAPTDPLPERLISCVHRAARPSHKKTERRAVPIYGVLTKKDKVDTRTTSFQEKKMAFMQGLGLNHSRFLVCSNYCDDLDPNGLRTNGLRPELDLPLLRFMQLVCDRALKVVKEDEVLPGSDKVEDRQNAVNLQKQADQTSILGNLTMAWQNLDPMYRDATIAAGAGLLTLMALYILLPASQGNAALSEACKKGVIKDDGFKTILCANQGSSMAAFQQQAGQMFVAAIITVIVFLYQHVNRRL